MSLRRALIVATLAFAPTLALADGRTEMFLVDSSDGYGIDTCVASGQPCGEAMAGAWCRAHDYARAVSFGRVKSDAATPQLIALRKQSACYGNGCAETVAITCER
ncbi:hypothetical protein MWN34_04460 [Ancylobacter sp. 6x-1]|uniref:DUF4189 domain-containing protein n=1 Tax=Ancylobacter crimeensis TaxID=2579147 RepID=A0ABT0D8B4_9HYPH|nr:hypothetical protein [Ancylobacter crimeensis]MCK0196159.1 hypothetical protein [Ancylobacter crimeensis]